MISILTMVMFWGMAKCMVMRDTGEKAKVYMRNKIKYRNEPIEARVIDDFFTQSGSFESK